jgi:hypothetical protein
MVHIETSQNLTPWCATRDINVGQERALSTHFNKRETARVSSEEKKTALDNKNGLV